MILYGPVDRVVRVFEKASDKAEKSRWSTFWAVCLLPFGLLVVILMLVTGYHRQSPEEAAE